jgi:uncharacterized metal-binding protein YceD (DUF177 family)
MKPPPAPLSRPLDVSRVPATGCLEVVTAEPDELASLAGTMKLPAIHSLIAQLNVSRWRGQGFKIKGHLASELEQVCVVTLEQFRSRVEDEIIRYFLPRGDLKPDEIAMIEEGDADLFDGGVIDLGEVVAESLALALDPYPRRPGVEFRDVESAEPEAPASSDPASPFAALARLQRKNR